MVSKVKSSLLITVLKHLIRPVKVLKKTVFMEKNTYKSL